MKKLPRAAYTVEFKASAVQQVLAGKKIAVTARELGIVEQTLHNWIKQHRQGKIDAGRGKAVTPEQMEISRLKAELARSKMELEIVKKAAAYFAKESL